MLPAALSSKAVGHVHEQRQIWLVHSFVLVAVLVAVFVAVFIVPPPTLLVVVAMSVRARAMSVRARAMPPHAIALVFVAVSMLESLHELVRSGVVLVYGVDHPIKQECSE